VVAAGPATTARTVLGFMAKPDTAGPGEVPVPLTLQSGSLWLGPARIATVPSWTWPVAAAPKTAPAAKTGP
jgi:hypothetical protein